MKTGNSHLDRLMEKMDRLDPSSLQLYVFRLIREKGFMETLFNTIREGVIVVDNSLKIRFINNAARALLGINEDPAGQRIDRHLREVDWDQLMHPQPDPWPHMYRQELEILYPEHRYLSFYLVPVRSAGDDNTDADISLATLLLQDVTETHRDLNEHVESQKVQAITMLAAGVAHELGNPMNSLNIHLQLLSRSLASMPESEQVRDARELIEIASMEVSRLDSIVTNFLQAVRPIPPAMKPVDLRKILSESIAFMRLEIEDRDIAVDAEFTDSIPQVLGDADQLKQAFYNIIKNAIHAMDGGGRLRIVCAVRDAFVDLRFSDTGKGISTEDMSRIMDAYFSTRPGGTGLGLLIGDRIVRSHGGELGIESSPERGATFTISLPLKHRRMRLLKPPADEGVIDIPPAGGTRADKRG
jgi:signal transduction histidine kinase